MPGDVTDLIDQLKQETEQAPIAPQVFTPDDTETTSFEPATTEHLKDQEDPDPTITQDKASSMARSWVKMFSSLMKLVFKPIYKKTILAKGDIEKMEAFRQKNAGMSEKQMEEALHSEHDLYPVANRFDRFMKAVEDLPLDQDEIDSIANPLSEVIVKYRKLQLGPEWMLLFAVCLVMVPRLSPMMPDLSKIFASADKKASA